MNTILRTILLLAITLALGGALTYEVYLISKTVKETSETLVLIDERTGNDGFVKSVLTFQEMERENLEILDRVSLTKEEIVSLIENLEDVGELLGLSINVSSVTDDTNKNKEGIAEIVSITIDSRGSWSRSLQFMQLLENLPHKVVVEKVDLAFDQGQWRNNTVLKVSTFPEKQ